MEGFTRLTGLAVAMPAANVDTDVIMPKIFLKGIDRSGLAVGLFHDLRFDEEGQQRPDFILNQPATAEARFLLVGSNFGCGSSREHAVWGMLQYGIRAIVGTSFAGIFADNAANNGLLLISLEPEEIARLFDEAAGGAIDLNIDLGKQVIEADGFSIDFEIDPIIRRSLMLGLDRIGSTLAHSDEIRAFERAYFADHPWLQESSAS